MKSLYDTGRICKICNEGKIYEHLNLVTGISRNYCMKCGMWEDMTEKKLCAQCGENPISEVFYSKYCDECIQWRFELIEKGRWKI